MWACMLEVGAVVGGAVENEHVGGQGGGEGGGPEDQALYFVCVLPRVQCSRTPLGEPEWGSFAQNRGGGRRPLQRPLDCRERGPIYGRADGRWAPGTKSRIFSAGTKYQALWDQKACRDALLLPLPLLSPALGAGGRASALAARPFAFPTSHFPSTTPIRGRCS